MTEIDVFEERRTADGRRRIQLTATEREAFRDQRTIEAAVVLFLDIDTHRTTQQIADELGLSRKQLKLLTQEESFIELYQEHYLDLGHDPRLVAVQAGLADLLPVALEKLRKLLTETGTTDNIRFKVIEKILELNGIKPSEQRGSDKRELAKFLQEAGATLNLTQINISKSQEHQDAVAQILEGEVEELEPLSAPVVKKEGSDEPAPKTTPDPWVVS